MTKSMGFCSAHQIKITESMGYQSILS